MALLNNLPSIVKDFDILLSQHISILVFDLDINFKIMWVTLVMFFL
jgi:hypothetical protein